MDKKLIAMCSCREVQSMWEPKMGDICVSSIDSCGTSRFKSQFKEWPKNAQVVRAIKGDYIRTCYAIGSGQKSYKREFFFIPRIEDVLEWLGDKFSGLTKNDSTGNYVGIYYTKTGSDAQDSDIPIKALLKAFMHLEYSKTWDGKQWGEIE